MTTHTQIYGTDRSHNNDVAPVAYPPLIDLTSDELEMLASLTDHKTPPSPHEPTYWPDSAWF